MILRKNNYLLLNWLEKLKSDGKIKRVGISIYEESDLDDIPLNKVDVIQIPYQFMIKDY